MVTVLTTDDVFRAGLYGHGLSMVTQSIFDELWGWGYETSLSANAKNDSVHEQRQVDEITQLFLQIGA